MECRKVSYESLHHARILLEYKLWVLLSDAVALSLILLPTTNVLVPTRCDASCRCFRQRVPAKILFHHDQPVLAPVFLISVDCLEIDQGMLAFYQFLFLKPQFHRGYSVQIVMLGTTKYVFDFEYLYSPASFPKKCLIPPAARAALVVYWRVGLLRFGLECLCAHQGVARHIHHRKAE